jgi:hypothetical protein
VDVRELARLRLRNQWLASTVAGDSDPAAVVARFGAMQAQEHALAKWSIGQRSAGLSDGAVQQALDDGRILRTHALRPTWHYIAAADLRWIQALTGPRVHGGNGYYNRLHGLSEASAQLAGSVIADALQGANYLTRADLGAVLADAGLPAAGGKLAYAVMRAELDGVIASGPMRGKQQTYALVSERVSCSTELEGDAALAELTRRYFTSHGPATVKDFAWWSSLTLAQVRHGIALLGDSLAAVQVGSVRYWYVPSDIAVKGAEPVAHVLQAYDEYVIAYTESRWLTNLAGVPVALPEDGSTVHAVMVAGQLAGLWRRDVGRRGEITATVRLLRSLTARDKREVRIAFDRYAAFAGVPVAVALT